MEKATLGVYIGVMNALNKCQGAMAIVTRSYEVLGDSCPFTRATLDNVVFKQSPVAVKIKYLQHIANTEKGKFL